VLWSVGRIRYSPYLWQIAERAEMDRHLRLECAGHFRRQVLPILPRIASCDPNPLLEAIENIETGLHLRPRQRRAPDESA
jgi:hypothetical protein